LSLIHRLNEEASSNLEASLTAKEKIISELHYELHKIEGTLGNEREEHLAEVKRLNALLNEKARVHPLSLFVDILET
jgi:homeobox protein cut-like